MAGILKVDQYQDFNGNNIMTSDGAGNLTLNNSALKMTPSFFVTKTSDQSITDATWTKATFDTEDYDTDSAFASSTFTVPSGEAGKYFFFSTVRCKASSGTMDYALFRFYKNGTSDLTPFQLNAASNQLKNSHIAGSAIYDLSVGDYIEVHVQISGTSPSIGGDSGRNDRSFFGGYKLIGA